MKCWAVKQGKGGEGEKELERVALEESYFKMADKPTKDSFGKNNPKLLDSKISQTLYEVINETFNNVPIFNIS